jgi:tripeptidyl-peptidase-1
MLVPCPWVLALILSVVGAKPLFSSSTVHERRADVPSGWYKVQRHDAAAVLPLRIGLAQANIDRIDEYVNDVAHPDSPNYGNHWSAERVAKTFAPTAESVDVVRAWLVDAGFARERVRVVPSRGWIEVNATVEEVERLLRTEYHVYRHEDSGQGHVGESFGFFFYVD